MGTEKVTTVPWVGSDNGCIQINKPTACLCFKWSRKFKSCVWKLL